MSASWRLNQYSRRLCGKSQRQNPLIMGFKPVNFDTRGPMLYLSLPQWVAFGPRRTAGKKKIVASEQLGLIVVYWKPPGGGFL